VERQPTEGIPGYENSGGICFLVPNDTFHLNFVSVLLLMPYPLKGGDFKCRKEENLIEELPLSEPGCQISACFPIKTPRIYS
jgi:hypothetical protein